MKTRVAMKLRNFFKTGSAERRGAGLYFNRVISPNLVKKSLVSKRVVSPVFSMVGSGYSAFKISDLDTFLPAYERIKEIISRKDFSGPAYFRGKPYLETGGLSEDDLKNSPQILTLALDERILAAVESYLGCRPYINHIGVWVSRRSDAKMSGSQFFHLDHADAKQVKVFIPIEDITEEKGPLTFLDKVNSDRLRGEVHYNWSEARYRLKDEEIINSRYQSKIQALCPKVGEAIALDTCNCFHMGSRVSSDQYRYLLVLQYLTPFSFVFWGKRKSINADNFELTQLALGECDD